MNENHIKRSWNYCNQYSPETTLFDTYLEERKSQNSTPNTIVHRSPADLKSELSFAMKNLQEADWERKSMMQFERLEFRKNLLKVINKDLVSNKEIIKQVIRNSLLGSKGEQLKKNLLVAVENSNAEKLFLIFNELGPNHTPIALYKLNGQSAQKLYGPDTLPQGLNESDIRFSLKFDSISSKFKVIKSKNFSDDLDAIILR